MDLIKRFEKERVQNILDMGKDLALRELSVQWILDSNEYKYSHAFSWMGRPIVQSPYDMFIMQELIWELKPDLIIETGIAHGGSIVFYASLLELLGGEGRVVGIDIDIRKHNRVEIEKHPMHKRITMIEGSSTDVGVVSQVTEIAKDCKCVMVLLDSCHTHEHVLNEMNAYGDLVTKDSFMVVFDTGIELLPKDYYSEDRPWNVGNNPMTALLQYLKENDTFIQDEVINSKAMISAAIGGYLKRVK